MAIIPATQEVEAKDQSLRPAQTKLVRPYLRNKIANKKAGAWLKRK
jgi:hypothetical protein